MAPKISGVSVHARAEVLMKEPPGLRSLMVAPLRQQIDQLAEQLATQYDWLSAHPNDPRYREFEDQWLADLNHYEFAYDALNSVTMNLRLVS